jgi:hypothetical protein
MIKHLHVQLNFLINSFIQNIFVALCEYSTRLKSCKHISLPPSTTHKTEQVYDNTLSDEDDNNGEATYGNVQLNDVTTKYRIPVTELHNVINEKHTNDGFQKEYEVSVQCWFL